MATGTQEAGMALVYLLKIYNHVENVSFSPPTRSFHLQYRRNTLNLISYKTQVFPSLIIIILKVYFFFSSSAKMVLANKTTMFGSEPGILPPTLV